MHKKVMAWNHSEFFIELALDAVCSEIISIDITSFMTYFENRENHFVCFELVWIATNGFKTYKMQSVNTLNI